jgi:hypothetical protein
MSTKRSINKIVERSGVRYIQGVVENTKFIFQEILEGNYPANDCFIEFISDNVATSFCIFGQIKSGKGYSDGFVRFKHGSNSRLKRFPKYFAS